MKQASTILSTYAADTSGICSALYELGGMTVIHDASGCNSTYTTHDEPRWETMPSMVYVSGLTEMDAVMGNEERLLGDIEETVAKQHPTFVAIASSPIPSIMGTDIHSLARLAEKRTSIPVFGFESDGMHDYQKGISQALVSYAARFVGKPKERHSHTVNLLGATPLDFSSQDHVDAIEKLLEEEGFLVHSCWAMGSTPEELATSAVASVNLVVSQAGMTLASWFFDHFAIPYVVGLPYGQQQARSLVKALQASEADGRNRTEPTFGASGASPSLRGIIIGEYVASLALKGLLAPIPTDIVCPLGPESASTSAIGDEQSLRKAVRNAPFVIADPLYRPIHSEGTHFVPLPHEAYSGRMFHSLLPDLTGNGGDDFARTVGTLTRQTISRRNQV